MAAPTVHVAGTNGKGTENTGWHAGRIVKRMFGGPLLLRSMGIRRRSFFIPAALGLALVGWGAGRLSSRIAVAASQPYQPCPGSGEPCRILPLGDSLTSGIGYEGGYRVALFQLARAAGKSIAFTGSLRNGPANVGGVAFPRQHEGRSGWKIEDVMAIVPRPALKTVPHIILLHVGTNDLYAGATPQRMADRLEALIGRLQQAAPQALIAVAEIVPLTDPALRELAERYNGELRQRVQARRARAEHLLVVDQFTHFPSTLLSDGVHPTQLGYEQMASAWYAGIAAYLR
ncbi:MAG TPA: GDSL-type esterase/lipase family protein [Polyangiaceae bacterium]|nr:GDSL-type esterase/lipase family protein [Polyangiaceae bacterium]